MNGEFRLIAKVAASFILPLMLQAGALIYWIGKVDTRVDVILVSQNLMVEELRSHRERPAHSVAMATMARLEQQIAANTRMLERIERVLENNRYRASPP